MSRLKAAFAILILVFGLTLSGHTTVRRITDNLEAQLGGVRESAQKKDFESASKKIDTLLAYFEKQQHKLEFFIKREKVAETAVNLHGLSAYTDEETVLDLCSEIDKVDEQIQMLEHLFFSIF